MFALYVNLLDNVSDNFIDLEDNSSDQEDLPEDISSDQEDLPEENSSDHEDLPEDISSDHEDLPEENSSDHEDLPEDISSDQDFNETNNYYYTVSYNSVSDNFVTFEQVALFDTTLIFLLACVLGALVFNAFMKKL